MNRTLVTKGHGPVTGRDMRSDPFFALQRGINRMFDDLWPDFDMPAVFSSRRFPSIEIRDEDKAVKVIADLPGLDDKDVELDLMDGILTMKGEKKSETSEKTDTGTVSERWYGHFERSVAVGDVDDNAVTATFENGVLTVILPKVERPKDTGHKIPIAAK